MSSTRPRSTSWFRPRRRALPATSCPGAGGGGGLGASGGAGRSAAAAGLAAIRPRRSHFDFAPATSTPWSAARRRSCAADFTAKTGRTRYAVGASAPCTGSAPERRFTKSSFDRHPEMSTPRSFASALSSGGERVWRIARASEAMRSADAPRGRIKGLRRLSRPLEEGADLLLVDPRLFPRELRAHPRGHELEAELRPGLRELHERVRLVELRLHQVLDGGAALRLQLRARVGPGADVRFHLVLHEVPHGLHEQVLRVDRADRVVEHPLDDVLLRHGGADGA